MVAPADGSAPSVQSLVLEAARRLAADDTAGAVGVLADAAARDPQYMPLHFVTSLVAWSLGDVAKSLTLARDCHEREPMNGTVAEVVASLYAQIGDMIESLYFGKLATALKPDPTLAAWLPHKFPSFDDAFLTIQERPLLAQARLLFAQGKRREGLDRARQHVEVAPGDADGRHCFGENLLRAGLAGVAVTVLQPLAEEGAILPPSASVYARALAQVGDAAQARRWHDDGCAGAPDDAVIAAARIADARWLGSDAREATAWSAQWLAKFAPPAKPQHWRPDARPLVIGYLAANFADRGDAVALAAVARAHKRAGVSVIGYGLGAQSWEENATLRGAFDKWRDITGFDPADSGTYPRRRRAARDHRRWRLCSADLSQRSRAGQQRRARGMARQPRQVSRAGSTMRSSRRALAALPWAATSRHGRWAPVIHCCATGRGASSGRPSRSAASAPTPICVRSMAPRRGCGEWRWKRRRRRSCCCAPTT